MFKILSPRIINSWDATPKLFGIDLLELLLRGPGVSFESYLTPSSPVWLSKLSKVSVKKLFLVNLGWNLRKFSRNLKIHTD